MYDLLKAYEEWEAMLIMDDEAWRDRSLPQLTQQLYDKLLELQEKRNNVIAKIKEEEL